MDLSRISKATSNTGGNISQTDSKKENVFTRLYERQYKANIYKHSQTGLRLDVEREIEKNCTFTPQINPTCPFISERTLRKSGNPYQKRKIPPPPPLLSAQSPSKIFKSKKKHNRMAPAGGMFRRATGLQKVPPGSAGIPLFYFDPFHPPDFQNGTYIDNHLITSSSVPLEAAAREDTKETETAEFEEIEVEEEIETDAEALADTETVSAHGLKAPPLPVWAFALGGDPSRPGAAVKKGLVINRNANKKEAVPEVSGWQAVLLEMQRKKDKKAGLKRVEVQEVKKPEMPRKKRGKTGKLVFKDHIEELSYKLAKMRGEIVESDGEEEAKPVSTSATLPATVSVTTEKGEVEAVKEGTDETKEKKSGGKPDLSNLNKLFASKSNAISASADTSAPPLAAEAETPKKSAKPDLSSLNKLFASKSQTIDKAESSEPSLAPIDTAVPKRSKPDLSSLNKLFASKSSESQTGDKGKETVPSGGSAVIAKVDDSSVRSPLPSAPTGVDIAAALKPSRDKIPMPPPLPETWPPTSYYIAPAVSTSSLKAYLTLASTTAATATASKASTLPKAKVKVKVKVKKLVRVVKTSSSNSKVGTSAGQTSGHNLISSEMQSLVRDLIDGYYLAEPVKGMVNPGSITAGGLTTQQLCQSLKIAYQNAQSSEEKEEEHNDTAQSIQSGSTRHQIDPNHSILENKLTLGDLPLPADYHSSIERVRKCQKKREEDIKVEKSTHLRRYLDPDYQPDISMDHANLINYVKKNEENMRKKIYVDLSHQQELEEKSLEVTVPVEFISNVDKRNDNKPFSFRKNVKKDNTVELNDLSLDDRMNARYKILNNQLYSVKNNVDDRQIAFWVNSLRTDYSDVVGGDRHRGIEDALKESSRMTGSMSMSPIRRRPLEDDAEGISVPTAHNQYMSTSYRPLTVANAPMFRSDAVTEKRISAREEKKQELARREAEEKERIRQRKHELYQKTIDSAHIAGVYRSKTRYHQHQKLLQKYGSHPEVGIPLLTVAQKAYQDYSAHHLKPEKIGSYIDDSSTVFSANTSHSTNSSYQEDFNPSPVRHELHMYRNLQSEFKDFSNVNNASHPSYRMITGVPTPAIRYTRDF